MRAIRLFVALAVIAMLAACGGSKFKTYHGPDVTRIEVHKADRKMYLLHYATVLKTYDISMGFQPVGHKQFEGDGKTPEGAYYITHRNPRSNYYLSLGISYPNDADRAYASSKGMPPGGDIFIHGFTGEDGKRGDWTAGCIAVKNREMEQIYSMVKPGTPIVIYP